MKKVWTISALLGISLMLGLAFVPLQNVNAQPTSVHKSQLLIGPCLDTARCPVYIDRDNDRVCDVNEWRMFLSYDQAVRMISQGIADIC